MKSDLLNREDYETDREYFTKAAAYIDRLRISGNEVAVRKAFKQIGRWLVPVIEEYVDCESARYKLNEDIKIFFSEKVYETIYRIFHKYNNPMYMDLKYAGDQFELKTFIKTRCKCCMRDAIADILGIKPKDARKLLKIIQAKDTIACTACISYDDVSVDDIYTALDCKITREDIEELLLIKDGHESIDAMIERGKELAGKDTIDIDVFGDEITKDEKQVLDEAFLKCSGLDIYILMQKMGFLDEKTNNMKLSEFVKTDRFRILFDSDLSIRSRKNPVRTVNNKRAKMFKILSGLQGKINMCDIEGCTRRYFYDCLMNKVKPDEGAGDSRIKAPKIFLDKLPKRE